MNHREQQAVEAALEYADSDQGKTDLGRDGRAALICWRASTPCARDMPTAPRTP